MQPGRSLAVPGSTRRDEALGAGASAASTRVSGTADIGNTPSQVESSGSSGHFRRGLHRSVTAGSGPAIGYEASPTSGDGATTPSQSGRSRLAYSKMLPERPTSLEHNPRLSDVAGKSIFAFRKEANDGQPARSQLSSGLLPSPIAKIAVSRSFRLSNDRPNNDGCLPGKSHLSFGPEAGSLTTQNVSSGIPQALPRSRSALAAGRSCGRAEQRIVPYECKVDDCKRDEVLSPSHERESRRPIGSRGGVNMTPDYFSDDVDWLRTLIREESSFASTAFRSLQSVIAQQNRQIRCLSEHVAQLEGRFEESQCMLAKEKTEKAKLTRQLAILRKLRFSEKLQMEDDLRVAERRLERELEESIKQRFVVEREQRQEQVLSQLSSSTMKDSTLRTSCPSFSVPRGASAIQVSHRLMPSVRSLSVQREPRYPALGTPLNLTQSNSASLKKELSPLQSSLHQSGAATPPALFASPFTRSNSSALTISKSSRPARVSSDSKINRSNSSSVFRSKVATSSAGTMKNTLVSASSIRSVSV